MTAPEPTQPAVPERSARAPVSMLVRGAGAALVMGGSQFATHWAAQKLGRPTDHEPFWMWLPWFGAAHGAQLREMLGPVAVGVATAIGGIGLLARGGLPTKQESPSDAYGSARFASTQEIRAVGLGTRGVVLCQEQTAVLAKRLHPGQRPAFTFDVVREAPLICTRDSHCLVEASTGSGKDEGIVLPTALSDRGRSVVFLQPNDDTWKKSAGWRSLHSRVLHITPCAVGGAGFNPLLEIPRGVGELGEAERIAHALVGANERDRSEGFVYWQAGQQLLTAAFLYVLHYGLRKSLPGTREFLANPKRRQRELVAELASSGNPGIQTLAHGLLRMAEETKGVIAGAFTTALNALSFCTDSLIADTLDRSDFVCADLNQLDVPMSVYLTIPEREMTRLPELTRLLTNTLVAGVSKTLNYRQEVLMVLNEFCQFGPLPALASGFADLRKYGVQLVLMVQDRGQIHDTYKSKARSIINNCGVQLVFGVNDQDSTELVSRMLGKRTVEETRTSRSKTTRPSRLVNVSESASESSAAHARDLMTSDEVRALDPQHALLFVNGARAYRAVKVVRYADRRFKARAIMSPPRSLHLELPPKRPNAWLNA